MFSVPQPALPAPSDVLDGRPVVHLSGSAHDFKQLLHLLYDGVKFMPPDQPVAFSVLAAVMRLGHKYHIEWILEGGKRRLRSIFTSSYDVWSRNQGSSSHLVDISSYSPWIEAINLIQLIGATDMLPVAIYQCCQFPSELFKGTTRVDGTPETLGLPTLDLCFNAYASLIQRQSELNAETFCRGPSESCQRKEACGEKIRRTYRIMCIKTWTYLTGSPMNARVRDLIERMQGSPYGTVCDLCAAALIERDQNERREVWRDLPSITGVKVHFWDHEDMDNA